jgi:hypothetical protein
MAGLIHEYPFRLSVSAPKEKRSWLRPATDNSNQIVGELLPTGFAMTSGLAGIYGEDRVQKDHAVSGPRHERAIGGAVNPRSDLSSRWMFRSDGGDAQGGLTENASPCA